MKDMDNLFQAENKPKVSPVREIVEETPKIRSLYLDAPEIASQSKPGQFLMVWVLGVDEVPMAVSKASDGRIGITVEKVGDATKELHKLEEGDLLGVRGPYGNGFDLSGENLLVVCGGCGTAPLAYAVDEAVEMGKEVTVVLTAKTSGDLLFKSRFKNLDIELVLGTEDGTAGIQGNTTEVLEKIDLDKNYDSALVCGPEKMMHPTARMIEEEGIPVQVSIDRYMKCGIGICGQCSIDPSGARVCEEGPVFKFEEIKDGEFGDYRRDETGKRFGI